MHVALVLVAAIVGLAGLLILPGAAEPPALVKASTEGKPRPGTAAKPRTKPATPAVAPAKASKSKAKVKAPPAPPPTPARQLFGASTVAAPLAVRAIGFYARGCLSGARALPIDGPDWQAMRLSRNRNWGHPKLIALVEKLARDAKATDGWPGLLVGDLSQPRGGPMLTGHASHQIGLDADIWLTAMPDRRLTAKEREELAATSMLAADKVSVDPAVWSHTHGRLIMRAASYPEVERVLVHPAIKKALCADAALPKSQLSKVRPYWGHHYHMHIRMACPKDSPTCKPQPPTGNEDGCGKEVDDWLARLKRIAAPRPPVALPKVVVKPKPPPKEITLDDLPPECKAVLASGAARDPSPVADVTRPDAKRLSAGR